MRETERECDQQQEQELSRYRYEVGGRGSARHWTPLKSSQKMLGSAVVVVVAAGNMQSSLSLSLCLALCSYVKCFVICYYLFSVR